MSTPLRLRHELKYFIRNSQYEVLKRLLSAVLSPDPHADETMNTIYVLSILTVSDRAYEKLPASTAVINTHTHIQPFGSVIRMECKSKYNNYIQSAQRLYQGLLATDNS